MLKLPAISLKIALAIIIAICGTGTGTAKADHVDDVISAQMKERHIPGVSLAVFQGGKIVREQGYGFSNEEQQTPVTPATVFQAASVSKPVAALGALRLVEQGKLSLDENVNARLQSWQVQENRFTQEQPVTLRRILSHSAGLTVHGFGGYVVGAPLPSMVQILDGQALANSAPVRVDQVPGSAWRYSGGGYVAMQQLMVDVTGQPFVEYMQETVFKPFGMNSSTFAQPLPKEWEARAATGYVGTPRRAVPGGWRVYPELAAAGLWTTAGDLARFYLGVQRSLAGTANPVISQPMTREMLTRQQGNSGLGFMVGGTPPRFGHNGDNVGFNAVTVAFPTGEGVVILLNAKADVDTLKNILVEAVGEQYRWPGYPPLPRPDA